MAPNLIYRIALAIDLGKNLRHANESKIPTYIQLPFGQMLRAGHGEPDLLADKHRSV